MYTSYDKIVLKTVGYNLFFYLLLTKKEQNLNYEIKRKEDQLIQKLFCININFSFKKPSALQYK